MISFCTIARRFTMIAQPKQKDQPKITTSLRGSVSDRGNPHLSGPTGAGRRIAPQGLRIATPCGLAMTVGDENWSLFVGSAVIS